MHPPRKYLETETGTITKYKTFNNVSMKTTFLGERKIRS